MLPFLAGFAASLLSLSLAAGGPLADGVPVPTPRIVHDQESSLAFEITPLPVATFYAGFLSSHGALVPVNEYQQGGLDLNGNGDTTDEVWHYVDFATGTLHNLQLATRRGWAWNISEVLVCGPRFLFTANEWDSGPSDFNGDGDFSDHVVFLLDPVAGDLVNMGIAVQERYGARTDAQWSNLGAFLVDEWEQGDTDLSGDGDILDRVVCVIDTVARRTTFLPFHLSGTYGLFGGRVLAVAGEYESGESDFNGDGDIYDRVLHLHDLRDGSTLNLEGATRSGAWSQHYLGSLAASFLVSEMDQGRQDLNGDGDTEDDVVFVRNFLTGQTLNLGWAASRGTTSPFVDRGRVSFLVPEEGGIPVDLNGDGDTSDSVRFVHHILTGNTENLGFVDTGIPEGPRGAEFLPLWVPEWGHGDTDLNGDGDALDHTILVHDFTMRHTFLTGLSSRYTSVDAGKILLAVREDHQGGTDLNHDGDALDLVLHVIDTRRRKIVNVQKAIEYPINLKQTMFHDASSDLVGFLSSDSGTLHVHALDAGVTLDLGLRVYGYLPTRVLGDRILAVMAEQDVDLNGDGDTDDTVPAVARRLN